MPNTILISGFPVWMKRGAAPLTVEFKGNSFWTLEAVGMTGICSRYCATLWEAGRDLGGIL